MKKGNEKAKAADKKTGKGTPAPDAALPEPKREGPGRPLELTQEKIRIVASILQRCAYVETAAAGIGVSRDTFYRWLRDGTRAQERANKGETLSPEDELLAQFSDTVKKEQAGAEIRLLDVIQYAARQSWPAAAWILERTRPERYSRRDRQVLENPDGSALADPLVEALNKVYGQSEEEAKPEDEEEREGEEGEEGEE